MVIIKCDTCGKKTDFGTSPIHLEFGYGSGLDGNEYHFDNLKCLFDFVIDEMKKGNPENRFEYGKENLK